MSVETYRCIYWIHIAEILSGKNIPVFFFDIMEGRCQHLNINSFPIDAHLNIHVKHYYSTGGVWVTFLEPRWWSDSKIFQSGFAVDLSSNSCLKLSSCAECRIRTQGLRHQIANRLNSRWQTDWAIEDQAKNLNSDTLSLWSVSIQPLDPTASWLSHAWHWRYICLLLLISMLWHLSIPKLQHVHRWSLGMNKKFHPTLYNGCYYLSMLGLKFIHVSKMGYGNSQGRMISWAMYIHM